MKNLRTFLLLVLCLSSCGTKEVQESAETSLKSITFEKLDSIRIDYLGNPIVHDIDPISKRVLFMEFMEFSNDIMVVDFDGNILNSFLKSGDFPDSYGGLVSNLRIDSDSSFFTYGSNGLLRYDFSGKLLSKIDHLNFQPPIFNHIAMRFGMGKIGDRYIFEEQDYRGLNPLDNDHYKDLYLLSWLGPETGEKEPFLQVPEESIFRNGKYFFGNSWKLIFTVSEDLIYVAFGIEPVIYAFKSVHPYSLVKTIPLDLEQYEYFKGGNDYASVANFMHLRNSTGRIESIKKINGYFVEAYFPGFNNVDIEQSLLYKSSEEAKVFRDRMQKKYPNRIGVLDSTGNRLKDSVPMGLVAEDMLLRNGELWMMEKPDNEVERNYFRLFRVGLKVVE